MTRDHREPPDPPFALAPGRICRMDGVPLTGRRRRWCSDACAETWVHVNQPAWCAWRFRLDTFGDRPARCFGCGRTAREATVANVEIRAGLLEDRLYHVRPLELDHVKPLWSLTAGERLELKWWLPFNLQLLCHWCHAAKSAEEARRRAWDARRASWDATRERLGLTELLPGLPAERPDPRRREAAQLKW